MKKLVIVGAGNAGVITACHFEHFGRQRGEKLFDKIDIYYDPNVPIERVGQGTTLGPTKVYSRILGTTAKNNNINYTIKAGINYEGWGRTQEEIFHPFLLGDHAIHYQPNLISKAVIESKLFNVYDHDVSDLSSIDADYIFDCRGKHKNKDEFYDQITNPLNHALLSSKETPDPNLTYTRCVATPDGWCFVIPNVDSVAYGYLFNSNITSKEKATENFENMFDVKVKFDLSFKNYVAKNMWEDDRIILNGNRYAFIEPLEATSTGMYQQVARLVWDHILCGASREECNARMYSLAKEIETFILWHYQKGSKYDTPFWDYAKSLPFDPSERFNRFLTQSLSHSMDILIDSVAEPISFGGQWQAWNFKNWNDGVSYLTFDNN